MGNAKGKRCRFQAANITPANQITLRSNLINFLLERLTLPAMIGLITLRYVIDYAEHFMSQVTKPSDNPSYCISFKNSLNLSAGTAAMTMLSMILLLAALTIALLSVGVGRLLWLLLRRLALCCYSVLKNRRPYRAFPSRSGVA
jgi:hypothetical protein